MLVQVKRVLILFFLIFTTLSANAEEKQDDIKKLLKMTGSGELAIQVMENMVVEFKKILPQVPEEFWKKFMEEIDPNEMIELVVPIYDKYFTHEDIKTLIMFYETPVGQKYIKVMPVLTQ